MKVDLTEEELELVADTLFQKHDRMMDVYEKSNSKTKFRILEKAEKLRLIIAKLRDLK